LKLGNSKNKSKNMSAESNNVDTTFDDMDLDFGSTDELVDNDVVGSNGENKVEVSNVTKKPMKPNPTKKSKPSQMSEAEIEEKVNNARRKPLIEVTNEQLDIEDFNSTVVDDDAIREMDRIDYEKEEKEEKKKELIKKLKKVLPIAGGALVVIIGIIVGINTATSDKGVQFTAVDVSQYMSTKTRPTALDAIRKDNVPDPVEVVYNLDSAKIGEYVKYNIKVNAKTDIDVSYADFNTAMYVGLTDVFYGEDKVKEAVDQFNKTAKIDMKTADDVILVGMKVGLKFRDDYPLNLGNDEVYDLPKVSIGLTGKYVDAATGEVVTDGLVVKSDAETDTKYDIQEVQDVTGEIDTVHSADGCEYLFIVPMPKGLLGEDYSIDLSIYYGDDNKVASYDGIDIQ